jgi:hypothetical protein
MITKQHKTAFEIMERDHQTGESTSIDVVTAVTTAEAKSLWHIKTGQYDTSEYSYWVKHPICK